LLLVGGHLRKRTPVALGGDEDRVVAKPGCTSRLVGRWSLRRHLRLRPRCRRGRRREQPSEKRAPRAASGTPPSSSSSLSTLVGIGRVLPGVAGRIDARAAPERIDLQAGVVPRWPANRRLDECARLQPSVVEEGLAVLDHLGHIRGDGAERHPLAQDRRRSRWSCRVVAQHEHRHRVVVVVTARRRWASTAAWAVSAGDADLGQLEQLDRASPREKP